MPYSPFHQAQFSVKRMPQLRQLLFAAVTIPFALTACNSNATTLPAAPQSIESVQAGMHPRTIKTVGTGIEGPEGLALDARGNVYVVDASGGKVDKVSPPFNPPTYGALTTIASCGTPQLGCKATFPWGDAVDSHGHVYVTTGTSSVYELSPTGKAPTAIGRNLVGSQFIAVDGSGNLYVGNLDTNTPTIERIAPPFSGPAHGHVTQLGSGGFSSPLGIAVGADCKAKCAVYVTDTAATGGIPALKVIAPDGTVTTVASGFSTPYAVAVAANCVSACTAYVTDSTTNDVWKVSPNGKKTRLGSGFQFNLPGGVAVDAKGDVFVSDSGCECPIGLVKEILP
jgi:sugar lactone lactonase YvrE